MKRGGGVKGKMVQGFGRVERRCEGAAEGISVAAAKVGGAGGGGRAGALLPGYYVDIPPPGRWLGVGGLRWGRGHPLREHGGWRAPAARPSTTAIDSPSPADLGVDFRAKRVQGFSDFSVRECVLCVRG